MHKGSIQIQACTVVGPTTTAIGEDTTTTPGTTAWIIGVGVGRTKRRTGVGSTTGINAKQKKTVAAGPCPAVFVHG